MPLRIQRDVKEIEDILNEILNTSRPPVARCRLLSSGFNPAHGLNIAEDISGRKECIGCGNCIDICPFLFREPSRRDKTEQRTSMALESIVGDDCDQHRISD
jgi:ferredoxin